MRALRLTGGLWTIDAHAPDPPLPAGEVRVRVRRVSLTREDFCELPSYVPGRDFVGTMEGTGEGAASGPSRTGERSNMKSRGRVVGLAGVPCASCEHCRAGIAAHCRELHVLGATRDGACAEAVALPPHALHPVPEELDDEAALFAREVGWALLVARALEIQSRPFVTVLGDSPAALICAQVLAGRNASVRLLGERAERLELCERWGVRHRHWGEVGRRQDQAVVVDCTGTAAGISLACDLLRPRGTLILQRSPSLPCDLSRIVGGELTVLGLRAGLLPEAIDLLARGGVDTGALITRRVKLEGAPEAVRQLLSGSALKIVVEVSADTERVASSPRRGGVGQAASPRR